MASSTQGVKPTAAEAHKKRGLELARRHLANPQNKELRDEVIIYCQKTIEAIVRYLVIDRGYFPPWEDKYEYVHDACQDVVVKVLQNVQSLRSPANLFAWLREIALNVIVDAYRRAVGRGDEKRHWIGTEIELSEEEEDEVVSILDTKAGLDAATRHLGRSLTEDADAEHWTEKISNRMLLERALAVHVDSGKERDFESSVWIKETWEYPHLGAKQIAAGRNRSVGDTYHILHHDNEAVSAIAKYLLDPTEGEQKFEALINEIERATVNVDPGFQEAGNLAERWRELGGELDVIDGLRAECVEKDGHPPPRVLSDSGRAFIRKALEAAKKKADKGRVGKVSKKVTGR